jgi:hypothetical protein
MSQAFEQELYEAVGQAFPGLTVRAMSKLLGKSSGYWSSMTSQKFPLPTETLMYLSDVLECQKILLPMGSRRACQLESIQVLLFEEISSRLAVIRSYLMLSDSNGVNDSAKQHKLDSHVYEPLPFLVGRY